MAAWNFGWPARRVSTLAACTFGAGGRGGGAGVLQGRRRMTERASNACSVVVFSAVVMALK